MLYEVITSADSPHRYTHEARQYLFCSASCRDKFVARPGNYLYPEQAGSAGDRVATADCPDGTCDIGSVMYTCPMHPEVREKIV